MLIWICLGLRGQTIVQQLKGGDPMSSEKPGAEIGFVCIGGLVEQPLLAI